MGQHDVLHDRKTQARPAERPAPGLVHSVETFEDAGQVFLLDSGAFIGYADRDGAADSSPAHQNARPSR